MSTNTNIGIGQGDAGRGYAQRVEAREAHAVRDDLAERSASRAAAELDLLRRLEIAARVMRASQKTFFKSRTDSNFEAAKQAERVADQCLADLERFKRGDTGNGRPGESQLVQAGLV